MELEDYTTEELMDEIKLRMTLYDVQKIELLEEAFNNNTLLELQEKLK